MKKKINHQELIAARGEMQRKIADKLGRMSKDDFKEGDDVLCQDITTKKWTIKGKIVEGREDGGWFCQELRHQERKW